MTQTRIAQRELHQALAGRERQTGRSAERLLRAGFTVAPVIAGLDKFSDRLVQWDEYLAPIVTRVLPIKAKTFMKIVGVVEVAGGLLVAARPSVGGRVVGAWIAGIVGNLLLHPRRYLDIALRDVGLSLGAFALASLDADRRRERRREPLARPALTREGAVPMPQRLRPTLQNAPSA